MKPSLQPRKKVNLSDSVHRQLNMYALAASAAGVSLLALARPVEAKIVYTPAHVIIGKPFPLDLNHDGIVDFYLLHGGGPASRGSLLACQSLLTNTFSIFCAGNVPNAFRGTVSMGGDFGAALRSGAKIQPGDRFFRATQQFPLGGYTTFGKFSLHWFGPWMNGGRGVKNRYLGLKFKVKGQFHFGWARLTVTTTRNNFTATLTGYAYETIPGKAIIAGKTKGPDVIAAEPGSLGALAAGAARLQSRAK